MQSARSQELCPKPKMGRSYLTVRALVFIVTLLVIVEYFSLLQSAENADKRGPLVFRIVESDDRLGYNRHVLQVIDPSMFQSSDDLGSNGRSIINNTQRQKTTKSKLIELVAFRI